jgi:hypothetical protein
MDQTALVDQLMDQAHKALLVSEEDKTGALYDLYEQAINNLVADLQKINAKWYALEEPTFSDWKRLGLDAESFNYINLKMGVHGGGLKQQSIDRFATDLVNYYKEGYLRNAYILDSATPANVDVGFHMPPDSFLIDYLNQPWKGTRFSEDLGIISDFMAHDIQGQLVLSMWGGDSVDRMASRIRDWVGIDDGQKLKTRPRASAQLSRALTIARTEMSRAATLAQNKMFEENSDILDDKVWTAKFRGSNVCEQCADRNGLTPSEIEELADDLEDDPPGHPRCVCRWAPKVKSWDELLGDLGKGMKGEMELPEGPVKPAPYEEWSNDYVSPGGFVRIHAEVR